MLVFYNRLFHTHIPMYGYVFKKNFLLFKVISNYLPRSLKHSVHRDTLGDILFLDITYTILQGGNVGCSCVHKNSILKQKAA